MEMNKFAKNKGFELKEVQLYEVRDRNNLEETRCQ